MRFLFDLILNSQSLNYKHCMADSMENYLRDLGSERVKWRPTHCDIYYILRFVVSIVITFFFQG